MPLQKPQDMYQQQDIGAAEPKPKLPEQKIELPPQVVLQKKANPKIQATLDKFESEQKYELWVERNPDKEYIVPLNNGKVGVVAETITINGVMWPLYVGKNVVPQSIYSFYAQTQHQKHMMAAATSSGYTNMQIKPGSNVHYGDFTPSY